MEKLISEFSVGLFFWQTLIFLGLLFLLRRFAWKPILGAIQEREKNIEDSLASAEKAKKEMEELQSKNEALLAEAREERAQIIKEAKETKDKMIADAKKEAQVEADRLMAQTRGDIQNEKNAAMAEIKDLVANFSVDIAEKVLRAKLSDDDKQKDLVKSYIDDLKLN